ncbi:MAG: SH3 domain-containing protein [Kiritimatiellia bacterium]
MSPAKARILLAALAIVLSGRLPAQWPFGGFTRMPRQQAPRSKISGRAELAPSRVFAGEPCAIVIELALDKGLGIEELRVNGLPDADSGVVYGEEIENLPDTLLPTNRVLKRFRLPARFLSPRNEEIAIVLQGMQVSRRQQGGMSFSSSSSFSVRLPPFSLAVLPLPDDRKPADFSGAIGTGFRMTQTLSADHVHPGDLITATYELAYDGHCPSNAWPRIERLSRAFKAYAPKEVARTDKSVTWTQILVPQTTAATNTPLVSLDFFNVRTRRYEVARANPKTLVFVSDSAAPTENTAVVIATEKKPAAEERPAAASATGPLVLRLAPSEKSPVLATLPPHTPVRVLAQIRGWRRVETPRAIGWTR